MVTVSRAVESVVNGFIKQIELWYSAVTVVKESGIFIDRRYLSLIHFG